MLSTEKGLAHSGPFAAVRRESGRGFDGNGTQRGGRLSAPMSAWSDDAHITLEFDLPGVKREEIELFVEDGKLWVRGERLAPEATGNRFFDDRRYGPFERVIGLSDTIDPGSIDARLENGVLTVTLSQKPEAQPRRIAVKAANGSAG